MEWGISGEKGGSGLDVDVIAKAGTIWSCQYLDQLRASCMRREFKYNIKGPTLPTLCSILGWTV
jgi:hypothetical protein